MAPPILHVREPLPLARLRRLRLAIGNEKHGRVSPLDPAHRLRLATTYHGRAVQRADLDRWHRGCYGRAGDIFRGGGVVFTRQGTEMGEGYTNAWTGDPGGNWSRGSYQGHFAQSGVWASECAVEGWRGEGLEFWAIVTVVAFTPALGQLGGDFQR